MRGQQIPTSVKTTLCMSPFSAAGAIGSGALAMFSCKYDKCGNAIPCSSPFGSMKKKLGSLLPKCTPSCGQGGGGSCTPSCGSVTCNPTCCGSVACNSTCYCVGQCQVCCVIAKKGGLISKKTRGGAVGCRSLMMRGALPVRR